MKQLHPERISHAAVPKEEKKTGYLLSRAIPSRNFEIVSWRDMLSWVRTRVFEFMVCVSLRVSVLELRASACTVDIEWKMTSCAQHNGAS